MGIQKYIGRLKEAGRNKLTAQQLYIGLVKLNNFVDADSSGVNDTLVAISGSIIKRSEGYGAYPVTL